MEIERLIWGQDKPYELFEDATGDSMYTFICNHCWLIDVKLANNEDKLPDLSFTIVPKWFLNLQVIMNAFAINSATSSLAPQLVVEVAICNEFMPQLAVTDLVHYFAPGTGTRMWVGIKIWKSSKRWWYE